MKVILGKRKTFMIYALLFATATALVLHSFMKNTPAQYSDFKVTATQNHKIGWDSLTYKSLETSDDYARMSQRPNLTFEQEYSVYQQEVQNSDGTEGVHQPLEVDADAANKINSNNTSIPNSSHYWKKVIEGCGYSFMFIFLSEIGDKTFLFVVLYATRMNGWKLFIVSSIGLCGMHIAATGIGNLTHYLFSDSLLHWITVFSFLLIGLVLILLGVLDKEVPEDFEHKLKEIETEMIGDGRSEYPDELKERLNENPEEKDLEEATPTHKKNGTGWVSTLCKCLIMNESLRIITTIICTEMADRSQISAVALAANYDFWIVSLAGSVGHMLALVLAILFGKAVSGFTTEKCINI